MYIIHNIYTHIHKYIWTYMHFFCFFLCQFKLQPKTLRRKRRNYSSSTALFWFYDSQTGYVLFHIFFQLLMIQNEFTMKHHTITWLWVSLPPTMKLTVIGGNQFYLNWFSISNTGVIFVSSYQGACKKQGRSKIEEYDSEYESTL